MQIRPNLNILAVAARSEPPHDLGSRARRDDLWSSEKHHSPKQYRCLKQPIVFHNLACRGGNLPPAPAGSKSLRCVLGQVVYYYTSVQNCTPTCRGLMKLAENRFLSGPRAGAGAVAANETGTSHHCGAATGGAKHPTRPHHPSTCRGGCKSARTLNFWLV